MSYGRPSSFDDRTKIILLQVAYKEAAADVRASASPHGQEATRSSIIARRTVEQYNAIIEAAKAVGILTVIEPEPVQPQVPEVLFASEARRKESLRSAF